MKNSIIPAIAGLVAGLAIATLVFWGKTNSSTTAPKIDPPVVVPDTDGDKTSSTNKNTVIKKTVKPDAVKRVVPRKIRGEFNLVGRGEDAKWGVGTTANFKYTSIMDVDSKIESKEVLPGGEIKVTEVRTFNAVQDSLVVSDVDFKLTLQTVPLRAFSQAVGALAVAWGALTGDALTASGIVKGTDVLVNRLKEMDGTGVRQLLGTAGIQPTADVEAKVNQIIDAKVKKAMGVVRDISGKSYRISYYQTKSGQPMYITFTYADGSRVTNEQELRVMRRVNAFLDSNLVPEKGNRPGDTWVVSASDLEGLLDPNADGYYEGKITATRQDDDPKTGYWNVSLSPSQITVCASGGNTTGGLMLENGYMRVLPETLCVEDLFAEGTARIEQLSKHHLLFTARIEGECRFQGRVVTTPEK